MAQELVEALRHQRHRFQNHLQVISGWLHLGKPERASAYLASLRASREQEAPLFTLADWRLLAMLLGKHAMAEANGVEVNWAIEAPMQRASQELSAWLASRFDAALDLCAAHGAGGRVEVTLGADGERHYARIACFDAAGAALTRQTGPAATVQDADSDWQQTFALAPEQEP